MQQIHSSDFEPSCQDILNCMAEACIFVNTEGIIQIWNPGAEIVFGYTSSESVGRTPDFIIPVRMREAHWNGFHRAILRGSTVHDRRSIVTRSIHKDGHIIYVDMSFAIVKTEAGEVTGSVAIARDVTRQKLAATNSEIGEKNS